MADLAMASARPGAPDMRMPGKVTADMLAEDMAQAVGMLKDGLPEGMVAQTLLAGRAYTSPAWVS